MRLLVVSLAGGLCLLPAGCAGFVDQVTSRDFRVRDMIHPPDPLTVIRTRKADGDAFAKAMVKIAEPRKLHKSQAEQDEVVQILSEAATADPRSLCRLAAIDALGRFDDARTSVALMQAYQGASAFPSDEASLIRCAAMSAMGGKNTPETITLLSHVASTKKAPTPPSSTRQVKLEEDDELAKMLGQYDPDNQAARDARITAVRALGKSKDPQAVQVLIPLLDEKDVALRNRVQESLEQVTGRKNVPATSEAWRNALASRGITPERAADGIQ